MAIRRKANGFEIRLYGGIDPATGKEIRISKFMKTDDEREARRLEAKLMEQLAQNTYVPPAKEKLADFLADWLENSARSNVKPRTFERYEELVRQHIVPHIGAVKLDKLTPRHVDILLGKVKESGLSSRTALHVYRVLHRALEVAVRWNRIGRNICDAVEPPRVDEAAPTGLSPTEVDALLRAAEGHRLYPLLLTAIHTGMRLGELCGLRWEDVDLEEGIAVVRQALEKPGARPVFTSPKSRKERAVPLTPEVMEALRKLRVEQELERASCGQHYEDFGLVFCQPNGRPLDPKSLSRWHFKRWLEAAGLPKSVRLHDLRHTFVSRALAAGANPRAVSDIAGHHDPGFTLRRYAHALPDDTKEAVRRLSSYLKRRTASPECER